MKEESTVMKALNDEFARRETLDIIAKIRSAGTPSESIAYASMYSFARGFEVGRAARDEDEKKPA